MNHVQNRYMGIDTRKSSVVRLLQMPLVHLLVIIVLGFVIYSNTYNAPFEFDDFPYILNYLSVKNPHSAFNSIEDIKSSVITSGTFKSGMLTRPFAFLTFSINYQLNGLNVNGFHVVNILIHITNALLIYSFVTIGFEIFITRSNSNNHEKHHPTHLVSVVAFFVAILFVAHPVQTQAVTYIVQRFASMATLFYLLTIVLYLKSYTARKLYYKRGFYLISLLAAVLAMLTKEIAFTLPVIIILFEVMFLDGAFSRKFARCAPFFLTMGIIPYNLIKAKSILAKSANMSDTINSLGGTPTLSSIDYLLTEFRVIVTYLRLLFFPVNQNLDYNYPVFNSLLNPQVVASVALLTALIVAGTFLWYQSTKITGMESHLFRLAAFGIFWFFVTLSVESSFFPIESVIYEHRVYLPSVGFFLTIVSFITILMTKLSSVVSFKRGVIVSALLIVAILAGTAYSRNSIWKDSVTLWEDVVRKNPLTVRGHANLCGAYLDKNQLDDAERECSIAAQMNPGVSVTYYNLGLINEKKKQYIKAAGFYRMALNADSKLMPAHIAIGKIYQDQGLILDAIKEYKTVNSLDNNYFSAHYNLGLIYYDLGQYENAMKEYSEAFRLKSDFAPLYNSMGIAWFQLGSSEKAISMLKKALELDPANKNAISNLQKITPK